MEGHMVNNEYEDDGEKALAQITPQSRGLRALGDCPKQRDEKRQSDSARSPICVQQPKASAGLLSLRDIVR
jgi:hypothetical protein